MKTEILPFLYFSSYFTLFVGASVGLAFWLVKRRTELTPVEFRLLRTPGESLRRRVQRFDEGAGFYAVGAAMVPIVASLLVLLALTLIRPTMRTDIGLIVTGVVGLAALFFSGRWLVRRIVQAREDRLEYLGERAFGESMLELAASGYRVFHDVPMEGGELDAKVDHVAVGPKGVFAIETKTRRKANGRPGTDQHKVIYEENRLIWPWKEDDVAPRQATERARWLTDWVKQMTGIELQAIPVLAIPGWYVVAEGPGPVLVVNHKQLAETVTRINGSPLNPEQIALIARQLEDRCRDVKD